jgi:hypothetical protein
MSQARTNRRRARQLKMDNKHLSGLGVPRYAGQKGSSARRAAKRMRAMKKAHRMGRSFGYQSK